MREAPTDVPEPGLRRSYWLREALGSEADPRPLPPLRDALDVDVAIIGGGYTGLWTAYFLTERDPAVRVAILEQDICGGGPSGRNGGFLHGWWDQLRVLTDLWGAERALELARAADEAVAGTAAFCRRHSVDAWFRHGGYLRVSASPAQDDDWAGAVAVCRQLGVEEQYLALGSDEVRKRCASPALRGGAFMPNAATVQPARLARGLRRVLIERGVAIYEKTRVDRLNVDGGVEIISAGGRVRAEQAVLALNAWAAGWPGFRSTLVTWGSYIALTDPAPGLLEEIGWTNDEAITDSRFTIHYFRTTPDGRVAFGAGVGPAGYGGRIGPGFERDRRAVERTVAGLRRLLPAFSGVRVTEAWGGPIDVSADRLPIVGSRAGGRVHFAYGYSGNGVGPAQLAGRILAARLCGSDEPITRLPIVGRRTRRFPPEPIRYLGARIVREALIRSDELGDAGRRAGPILRAVSGLPRRLGYRLGPERRRPRVGSDGSGLKRRFRSGED